MNSGQYMEEGIDMSVEICKYDKNIYNYYAKLLMNEVISSQRIYEKYLEPAIRNLKIHYF